jgi:hypothetical protein
MPSNPANTCINPDRSIGLTIRWSKVLGMKAIFQQHPFSRYCHEQTHVVSFEFVQTNSGLVLC